MDTDRLGITFETQRTAGVFEISDILLLLGIDRDGRLTRRLKLLTSTLMCSNWALRSGCLPPSRVLAFACRLKPISCSKRPTTL
jgi:hypothetical protein